MENREKRIEDSLNRKALGITGTGNSQKASSFVHGVDGLRRRMIVVSANGNPTYTTDYVLDGPNVVQEIVTTSNNSNPVIAATYLNGPQGPLYRRPANSADVRWYVYDGGGNVVGEVDPVGNVTASEKHDVYGASRGVSGAATSKHGWQGQVGHQSDGEIGLVYMRARYYAPELGRFQSEDSAKNGTNWFTYCKNDSINNIDEFGKSVESMFAYFMERIVQAINAENLEQLRALFDALIRLAGSLKEKSIIQAAEAEAGEMLAQYSPDACLKLLGEEMADFAKNNSIKSFAMSQIAEIMTKWVAMAIICSAGYFRGFRSLRIWVSAKNRN